MNRKSFYTVLVIFMTAASVTTMLYSSAGDYGANPVVENQPVNIVNYEDREYLGYIFDDYNKRVNLSYVDKVQRVSADKNGSIEDTSLSVMTTKNTTDDVRALRSERAIEERAAKDEQLKKSTADTVNTSSIHDFDSSINLDDRVELMNIMRKLAQSDIIQFKKLFDGQTGESKSLKIMKALKENMACDDYDRLSGIFDKYRKVFNSN